MTTQNSLLLLRRYFFHLTLAVAIVGPICVSPVRAGLTVDIHTFRYPGVYVSYGYLNTNAIAPAAPLGDYLISSPNGSQLQFRYDASGFSYVDGGGVGTSDFNSYMNALTNGHWSIQVTNASSTNTYYFDVSATGLNANLFNTATITSPANNATNVSDDPTFTWTGGPIGWLGTADVNVQDEPYNNYYENASLPPSATSWFTPNPPLPLGTNKFQLVYRSNVTATVVASIPQTTNANAISGWESTAHLDINTDDVLFTVVSSTNTFDAHLVARYDFETANNPGRDSSGNDNSADCGGIGGPLDDVPSTNAVIHHYARQYFGDTSICFTTGGSAFPNLSNALSGSFSVTAWVKTTNTYNQDTDNAYFGSPILFAYSSNTNSTIPLTITGSKAAFTIYDQNGNTTTLHSTTTVNDGSYHFLAVTRNMTNGLMSLYVDGNREATGTSTTQAIRTTADIHLFGGSTDYEGLVDDVRIYSTDLTSNDVAVLANVQLPGGDSTLVAHYSFDDSNDLGKDSSPHQFDLSASGTWNGGDVFGSSDAIAGGGAVEFDSAGGNGGGYLSYNPTPSSLLSALSGSFSVSIWVKTTQSFGSSGDFAYAGAAVVSADVPGYPGLLDDLIPVALTDGEAAFNTGGNSDHTLNSANTVNDGNYHHIVVTREQATGEKKIYIDGVQDGNEFDEANVLNSPSLLTIGAKMDASQTDPAFGDPQNGYEGLLDDLQIYSSVLTPSQVTYLFTHPGNVLPTSAGSSGGHTNIAHYRFDDGGDLGHDDSGNDNNFNSGSSWGLPLHEYDQVGAAGSGGVRFYGVSSMTHAPPNESFTNITTATANSFSLSLWVKTEEVVGSDTDDALNGAVVIWQYESGTDDIIPVSITGNKVAFHTGDEFGNSETLHSSSDVTDGNYHHIVVTRDRATGVKKIYVDGALEATATGTTRVLNANDHYFSIGGVVGHSFDGTVDDAQFYSGVLSPSEIAALYAAPGSVAPDTTGSGGPTNITADLIITILRIQPAGDPDFFLCWPFSTISPAPLTTHEIHSPNGLFTSVNGQPHSSSAASLGQLLTEVTNGVWTIFINKNHPDEKQFTFSVSAAGVTTNLLQKVTILSPTNGSTGVLSVPTYSWSGPSGLDNLQAVLYYTNSTIGFTNLPPMATDWTNPPALAAGTNQLDVTYFSIGVTNFSFTLPVDGNSVPLSGWTTRADLQSSATSIFMVVSDTTPVQLANPNRTGSNFQFQFLSQSGKTNTVQSRTNLALGVWLDRTNILGDGSIKTVILPVSSKPEEFFRVSTQ